MAKKFPVYEIYLDGVIVTKVSSDNKGIDVYNYGITDGTNVCQWSYTKGTNQRWIFEPCN